ncbi:TFIIH/NER complex subunit [Kappamyces sp. JEL0829]|nr:TFIIH/NER complex subunit [Kappamyces sp. JEL0829]
MPAGASAATVDSNNDKCPVCLSEKYLNQNMKLLVSPCFHKMCEACVSRIFQSGPAPCPICKTTLRKLNFIVQTFDDLYVEKEIQIRKKVGKYFNKRPEDFDTLRAFNDYLEEAEDIIFNMINNVNVQETEEKIEKYRLENRELIERNIAKEKQEEKALHRVLAREKKEKVLRREAYEKQALEQSTLKRKEELDVINQLASAPEGKDVEEILSKRAVSKKKAEPKAFTKIKIINVKVASGSS